MKLLYSILALILIAAAFSACKKNTMSKIPEISLIAFGPDSMSLALDTAYLVFHLQDGDADLGNDPTSTNYDIYIKDYRFDSGYVGYFFPTIDGSVENPNKGIQGTCTFLFPPGLIAYRQDSVHIKRDTTHFELYIVDRAGNQSNHIITPNIILTQ